MKRFLVAFCICFTFAIKAFSQNLAETVDYIHAEHYSGYLENQATHDRIKIMWYPSVNMYRRCNHFDEPLRAVPQGFVYIDEDSGCVEDIPSGPHNAASTAYGSIQFEFDSSVLKTSSYPVLDATAADLKSSGAHVLLEGYASSEGSAAHNMRLAKDRANSVKTYLVNSGVDPTRVKVKSFGETHPIADNSTEEGRILNRRVEFHRL